MVVSRAQLDNLELPALPDGSGGSSGHSSKIHIDEFTRRNLKAIIHVITGELKLRGTKTPHVFLPFRSRIEDKKLELFLAHAFPNGSVASELELKSLVKDFDEFTLICAIKYIWSRLPNHEIIGWDVYLEFKRKEEQQGYPRTAFLTIMPKCLSSPSHASIVYDFLDLLVSIASNSQYNYLSGRKIAKMSSLWAFNPARAKMKSAFYDATIDRDNSFTEGLDRWKDSCGALFHLLLSFLRAMLPENDMDTLKLPKTLQSLLISNSYPPLANNDSVKSMIKIPCVMLKSTKPSENVYELLSKVRHTIKFDKKDTFISIENYTILKNIFKKGSTADIVASLSEESRRIFGRLTDAPDSSDYELSPGWAPFGGKVDENIPLFTEWEIQDVTIQDYYIWTWLSSLGSDQHSSVKRNFGRSLIAEVEVLDQRKWIVVSEQIIPTEEYLRKFKSTPEVPAKDRIPSVDSHKDIPLPPPPPPLKDDGLLPSYGFGGDSDTGAMDKSTDDDYIYPTHPPSDELEEYKMYLESLNDSDDGVPADDFSNKLNIKTDPPKIKPKKQRHRPPPPESPSSPSKVYPPTATNDNQKNRSPIHHPAQVQDPSVAHDPSQGHHLGQVQHPGQLHRVPQAQHQIPAQPSTQVQQQLLPSHYPNYSQPFDAHGYPIAQSSDIQNNAGPYTEPYDSYHTPYDAHKQEPPSEPFEGYHVPVEELNLPPHPSQAGQHPNDTFAPVQQIVEYPNGVKGEGEQNIQFVDQATDVLPSSTPSSPDAKEKKKKKKKRRSKKPEELAETMPMGYFPPGPPPNFIPESPNGSYFPPFPPPIAQEIPNQKEKEKKKKKSKRRDNHDDLTQQHEEGPSGIMTNEIPNGDPALMAMRKENIPIISAPNEQDDLPPPPPLKDSHHRKEPRSKTPDHLRPNLYGNMQPAPTTIVKAGSNSPTLQPSSHPPNRHSNASLPSTSSARHSPDHTVSAARKQKSLSPQPSPNHQAVRSNAATPTSRLPAFLPSPGMSKESHPKHRHNVQPISPVPNDGAFLPQPMQSSSPSANHPRSAYQTPSPVYHAHEQGKRLSPQAPTQNFQNQPHAHQQGAMQAPTNYPVQGSSPQSFSPGVSPVPHQQIPPGTLQTYVQAPPQQSFTPTAAPGVHQGFTPGSNGPQVPIQTQSHAPVYNNSPQPPHNQGPPQGYAQPPQHANAPRPPQNFQGLPQNYHQPPPPQNYYQAPPQAYNHNPAQGYNQPPQQVFGYNGPPQGYQPPHNQQPYAPPNPGMQQFPGAPGAPGNYERPARNTAGDMAMMSMPQGHRHNKNQAANKANLRAAFNQGSFGI